MVPDERRAAILAAARGEFSRRSYAAVSVADVAAAAGVSPPLVVFHFGSKQKLYAEVVQQATDLIAQGLAAVPGEPSLQRLAASVEFYAGYALAHRAGFLAWFRACDDASQPDVTAAANELRDQVSARILADLAATGAVADVRAPVTEVAVRAYLGYVDAAVLHWLSLSDSERAGIGPDRIARLAVGAFTGGLAALAEMPPPAAACTSSS